MTIRTIQFNDETHAVVPRELTAENGMKFRLIGEYSLKHTLVNEDGDEFQFAFALSWADMKNLHRLIISAAPPVPDVPISPSDPYHNLMGAIHDIEHTGKCDEVSLKTLKRVAEQIAS